jgi:hypothetical protein
MNLSEPIPTRLAMLGPSTRLKNRLNPNCPYYPSLSKEKMRRKQQTHSVCSPPTVAIF